MASLDEKLDMSLEDLIRLSKTSKSAKAAAGQKGRQKPAPMDTDEAKPKRHARGPRKRTLKGVKSVQTPAARLNANSGIKKTTKGAAGATRQPQAGARKKGASALQGQAGAASKKGNVPLARAIAAAKQGQAGARRLPPHMLPQPHGKRTARVGATRGASASDGARPGQQAGMHVGGVDLANMDIHSVKAAKRAMKTARDLMSRAEAVLNGRGGRGSSGVARRQQGAPQPRIITREVVKVVPQVKEVIKYVPLSEMPDAGRSGAAPREPFAPARRPVADAPPPDPARARAYLREPRHEAYTARSQPAYGDEPIDMVFDEDEVDVKEQLRSRLDVGASRIAEGRGTRPVPRGMYQGAMQQPRY